MRIRALSSLVVALALSSGQAFASEDPESAARFFKAGKAAYARRENKAAALAFEEAYRRAPRGAAIFNAGFAWDAAGEGARAADAYAIALGRADLEAVDGAHARERLGQLEAVLARIEVRARAAGSLSLAHAAARLPATIHVEAGRHPLVVTFDDGRTTTLTVTAVAGALKIVDVEMPPPTEPRPPPPSPPRTDAPVTRTLGYVALATGVALGATAIAVGVETLSARDAWSASQETDRSAHDRAVTLRTLTNVAWGSAAAFAGAGIVLLVASPAARTPSGALLVGPANVSWVAHF